MISDAGLNRRIARSGAAKAKRWLKRILLLTLLGMLGGIAALLYVGRQLVAPVPRVIGPPPEFLRGETVEFPNRRLKS